MLPDKIFSSRNTIILSIVVFLIFLVYRIALIFYPTPDIGGVEGNIIYFIQRILEGQPFYTDPEKAPYSIAQYSPAYYYIVAGVAKLTGCGPDDVLSLCITGRMVSLVFNLAYIFVVSLIARNFFSTSERVGYTVGILCFIFLEITSFGRPDSLNHLLFMLTFYFFLNAIKKEEEGQNSLNSLILAAIIAAAALFSKQTSFILPLIMGGWLLVKKQYRNFFICAALYIAMVVLFLLVVNYVLGVQLFYKNAITGINNGISPGWFRHSIIEPFYLKYGLLFVPAFIVVLFVMRKETRPLLQFTRAALLSLFVLLNFVAIKNGSNSGYLTEWWTLLLIVVGFYWTTIKAKAKEFDIAIPAALLWFVLIINLVSIAKMFMKVTSPEHRAEAMAYYNEEKILAETIAGQLAASDKYVVFTNYNTAESYMSNLLFRHAVAPQMDIIGLAAYAQKKFDYSDFTKALNDGRTKWMLMRTAGQQKKFFDISLDKYELTETKCGFNLYQFKP